MTPFGAKVIVYLDRTGTMPADVPTECRDRGGAQALSGTSTTRLLVHVAWFPVADNILTRPHAVSNGMRVGFKSV
jgi:hypothetical protein